MLMILVQFRKNIEFGVSHELPRFRTDFDTNFSDFQKFREIWIISYQIVILGQFSLYIVNIRCIGRKYYMENSYFGITSYF